MQPYMSGKSKRYKDLAIHTSFYTKGQKLLQGFSVRQHRQQIEEPISVRSSGARSDPDPQGQAGICAVAAEDVCGGLFSQQAPHQAGGSQTPAMVGETLQRESSDAPVWQCSTCNVFLMRQLKNNIARLSPLLSHQQPTNIFLNLSPDWTKIYASCKELQQERQFSN